jgi:hypothetical protein
MRYFQFHCGFPGETAASMNNSNASGGDSFELKAVDSTSAWIVA